jgi:hypothetical protein
MEIIQADSQMHHRVQAFIAGSMTEQHVGLTPDQLTAVWEQVQKHIEFEKQMVSNVQELLDQIKGKKMLVQEYLLHYLLNDEKKHDELLEALDKFKSGMYPYAG